MSAYFVTSTGTGIGKTFTSCALLHAARAADKMVRGYKPVISGWEEGAPSDTTELLAASGSTQLPAEISPWRFAAPLSPHRAAALEGREIALPALVDWSRAALAEPADFTLIEGVGGVMVPLNNHDTVLDWMAALGLPVILTTGSYLGAISHTLSALAVLRARGLQVAALVMNGTEGSTLDFAEAQAGLAPFITAIPLRIFQPRVSSWADAAQIAQAIWEL